jgi:hypothetical protein
MQYRAFLNVTSQQLKARPCEPKHLRPNPSVVQAVGVSGPARGRGERVREAHHTPAEMVLQTNFGTGIKKEDSKTVGNKQSQPGKCMRNADLYRGV